jgi:hypothetical protein
MISHLPERTMLFICLNKAKIYPFSSLGLGRADGPLRKLKRRIEEKYIFDCDGTVRKIEKIIVTKLDGDGFMAQFFSMIFGNWIVDLELSEPLEIPLSEIKSIISVCVPNSTDMDSTWLPDKNSIEPCLERIEASETATELFENLQLPLPENALDIL